VLLYPGYEGVFTPSLIRNQLPGEKNEADLARNSSSALLHFSEINDTGCVFDLTPAQ
jgi:hypothetical protein